MKKVTIQKYLNLYVLLLALGIGSVGCQRKTYTHPIVPAASEGVAQAQDSGSKEEGELNLTGTSDPGGGNGLDGKVFESYSQDILSHPAYKNYVEPLFVSMSKNTAEIQSKQGLKPNEQDAEKSRRSYERLFQYKTWYIAPVDLKGISKGVLGVTFMKNKVDQLALQTEKEVWIDSRFFNDPSMTDRDQGSLFLHEFMMSVYLLKYQKLSKILESSFVVTEEGASNNTKNGESESTVVNIDVSSERIKSWMDSVNPPEEFEGLKDADYENIRFVTSYLMNNYSKMTFSDFRKLLSLHGFDKRIFSDKEEKNERLQCCSTDQFKQALLKTQRMQLTPDKCESLLAGKKQCSIEFFEVERPEEAKAWDSVVGADFIGVNLIFDNQPVLDKKIFILRDFDNYESFGNISTEMYSLEPAQKDQKIESLSLSFRNVNNNSQNPNLLLYKVSRQVYVIDNVRESGFVGKSCTSYGIRPESLNTDLIKIKGKEFKNVIDFGFDQLVEDSISHSIESLCY